MKKSRSLFRLANERLLHLFLFFFLLIFVDHLAWCARRRRLSPGIPFLGLMDLMGTGSRLGAINGYRTMVLNVFFILQS